MSRRTTGLVAVLATTCYFGALLQPLAASAQIDGGVVDVTPVGGTATAQDAGVVNIPGVGGGVVDLSGGSASTPIVPGGGVVSPTTPATTPVGPSGTAITPKSAIRAMLAAGELDRAESAYFTWSSYWHEEDASMLGAIEQAILLAQYRKGDIASLLALGYAGDAKARELLLADVLSNGPAQATLPGAAALSAERVAGMAEAIRVAGESGDKSLVNMLLLLTKSQEDRIAIAAITALGNLGDKRVATDMEQLFDTANLSRSVYLGRALAKLGDGKAVSVRFRPQLRFPDPAVRARAALVLGAVGDAKGWPILYQLLMKREAPYYNLALVALGGTNTAESRGFVTKALQGTEEEQLAAMQSADIVPAGQLHEILVKQIVSDLKQPDASRMAAIRLVGRQHDLDAASTLRALALTNEAMESPAVRAAAIYALPQLAVLERASERDAVRLLVGNMDENLARAARGALLGYAILASQENAL